jgi:hypothetical protein
MKPSKQCDPIVMAELVLPARTAEAISRLTSRRSLRRKIAPVLRASQCNGHRRFQSDW